DIVLDGEVKNSGDVVLYSASGNVVIDSTNVNLNGLVYAPYGEIRITSMNVNMNNVILIAQKVIIEANGINGGMNQGMAQLIGTEYNVIGGGTGNESPVNPEDPDQEDPGPENPRDPSVLMQGIVRYEATEGLEDIGEAYFKDIMSMDDIGYTIEGYPCVKNQLLLMSKEGVTFTQIEGLAHSYDAEIVGYLELTGDYQIEFYEEVTPERLWALMEELSQNGLVEYCDYNLSAEIDCDFYTNDAEWNGQNWNSSWPGGKNWNVEMIDLEGALVNAGVISANAANADFSDLSGLTTVRIGLIDSAFDIWHEDLEYVTVWNNYSNPVDIRTAASLSENATLKLYHGNHVAGIMAAGYNNGKGITGICLKPFLYGFSMFGDTLSYVAVERNTTMKLQYALDLMIGNHVKVINYSMGDDTTAFAASQQKQYAINFLKKRTMKINHFLLRLLDKGYDFLIVTSAGNANNDQFYKYMFVNNGNLEERYVSVEDYYRSSEPTDEYKFVNTNITYGALNSQATISCNEVDATYTNVFSYSWDPRIRNRVIVVGAIEKPVGTTVSYNVATYSNIGNRVDILAPGDQILSCMISGMGQDYDYKTGTSMAAPHVSGVAGLAYSVNPDISAPELKDIIVNNYQMPIDGCGVLNAADVIDAVVQYETPDEPEEYTVQLHVTDANGNGVRDAAVEVRSWSQYWYRVLGAAMTINAVGG
ncbi:MAG: S8 family peptidase, partial [Lachnospiraceae bacterium]|nr:S8 family peptidase [Lachnospiraceae bacterium]